MMLLLQLWELLGAKLRGTGCALPALGRQMLSGLIDLLATDTGSSLEARGGLINSTGTLARSIQFCPRGRHQKWDKFQHGDCVCTEM